MLNTIYIKEKIKYSKKQPYSFIRNFYFGLKKVEIPNVYFINKIYKFLFVTISLLKKIIFSVWHFAIIKPTFQSLSNKVGHSLSIESKTPQVWNNPIINIGNSVTISGHTSFFGCPFITENSIINIGDNSYIGYATTIAIGEKISIGKNVKIAANCFLAGYYGHPTDATDRSLNKKETNIKEIIIEDNVWIGTNSKIMKNIKIGKNSIISAGSVVIKDVPENVIVAGNPAKIVKKLE